VQDRTIVTITDLAGASNESGVVDDGNFGDLSGYFFGNFRDKANNIIR